MTILLRLCQVLLETAASLAFYIYERFFDGCFSLSNSNNGLFLVGCGELGMDHCSS